MIDEEESPFAFHEGGSREQVTPTPAVADGVPRNRFMVRGGMNMTKRYSHEEEDNDEDCEINGKRR